MFEYLFFNFKRYEEVAFASSNITLQKNELKHILYAEMDEKETTPSELPNYKIEVEEKKSIFNFFKNLFKKKPQIYRIGNGESVELDGTMPGNPISGFLNKVGEKIEQFMNKGKEISAATAVKNSPEIYSTALTETPKSKQKKDPSLLSEGTPTIEDSGIIIPTEVTGQRKPTGSYIQSTPIKAEDFSIDSTFEENKDEFKDILDRLEDKSKTTSDPEITTIDIAPVVEPKEPDRTEEDPQR